LAACVRLFLLDRHPQTRATQNILRGRQGG
jgi:hypothetical protein